MPGEVNKDYEGKSGKSVYAFKIIMKPDFTYEVYSEEGRPLTLKDSYYLEKKWTDSDGNTWYWVKKSVGKVYEW